MGTDREISSLHESPGPEQGRTARPGAPLCDQYFRDLESTGRPVVCGTCPWTCEQGRKRLQENTEQESGPGQAILGNPPDPASGHHDGEGIPE